MSQLNLQTELLRAKEHYKVRHYEISEEIYREVYGLSPNQLDGWDRKFFAWALYRNHIKNPDDDTDLEDTAELITEITDQADSSRKDQICPYTFTVRKVIKDLKLEGDRDEDIIYWTEKLNPDLLSPRKHYYKGMETTSDRENWYLTLSKAYFNIGEYEKCIEICREGLENIGEEMWLKFRMAKSKRELGDFDEALEILRDIPNREWYVEKEIAENHYHKGEYEKALKHAIEAALEGGDIPMKLNLYALLEELFNIFSKEELADRHSYLKHAIRLNRGYAISEELEQTVMDAGFDLENDKYWEIEKELKKEWERIRMSPCLRE